MLKSCLKIYLFAVCLCLTVSVPASAEDNCANQDFSATRRFRAGELLVAAAVGDFNRDGKADAAIVDGYSS
ncbi:MAG TPA: hypothetical protein VEQ34_04395, partial [Pyrinomonadaceae bacterium]|nr:hypothetical protein [Pyrinomonadaceae bacterium]